jgi:hypothetical protein
MTLPEMNTRFTLEDLQLFVDRGLMAQTALEQLPEYRKAVRAVCREGAVKKPIKRPEQDIQRALCKAWALSWPDSWALTFHSPNGLAAKNPKLAGIFKGLGLKPGVPDLLCLQRRGPYSGMALELKADDGATTKNQRAWAAQLVAQGYYVGIAFTLDAGLAMVSLYNGFEPGPVRAIGPGVIIEDRRERRK